MKQTGKELKKYTKEKTWPYGTRLQVRVMHVSDKGDTYIVQNTEDGFIIHGVEHDVEPYEGDIATIEFCKQFDDKLGKEVACWKMIASYTPRP